MLASAASAKTSRLAAGQCRRVTLIATLALLLFAAYDRADETLAGLRADVRTPPEQHDDDSPESDREHDRRDDSSSSNLFDDDSCDDGTCDDDSGDSGLALLAFAVASPFWGPPAVMMDSYHRPGYFSCYPYQFDVSYMLIDPPEALGLAGPRDPHIWAARIRGEFGTGFDDLDWIGGHAIIDTTSRIGVESDFRYVREDLDAGRDQLWLGDANVLFRFAQSEFMQFHAGLGMNFLADAIGSDFGFNFTYGIDCQPVRPLVFAAELDLGTLGHASVVHVRTTAGAMWGPSEAFIGYDLYDVGSTQIQGLVAGVQIWF